MSVRAYVEGGGNQRELKAKSRRAFKAFFEKRLKGKMPKVIPCGSREKTYDQFCTRWTTTRHGEFIILLVDSESPVAEGSGTWPHLKKRDNWEKPDGATGDHAHLMVQCMEAWFLADKERLVTFFGHGFNPNPLPGQFAIEDIPKNDLQKGLSDATRQCRKGKYHKGNHSFAILAELNPEKVIAASPHARRLFKTLVEEAG